MDIPYYGMVQEKLALNISYYSIAAWLSKEGLTINENSLSQGIWAYKRKIKSVDTIQNPGEGKEKKSEGIEFDSSWDVV